MCPMNINGTLRGLCPSPRSGEAGFFGLQFATWFVRCPKLATSDKTRNWGRLHFRQLIRAFCHFLNLIFNYHENCVYFTELIFLKKNYSTNHWMADRILSNERSCVRVRDRPEQNFFFPKNKKKKKGRVPDNNEAAGGIPFFNKKKKKRVAPAVCTKNSRI